MAEETFLRSLSKQIPLIEQLAKDLKFESPELDQLFDLHAKKEIKEEIDCDLLTEYEVKIYEMD